MMTLQEAAERLGVTADTLRQQAIAGRLRARKVGPIWTVSEREVERYRADQLGRHGPTPGVKRGPRRKATAE